jgi:dCMP deaminase
MQNFYMTMAEECAKMSRARRLQVGSVVVKNDNIISFSWNGMPAGWDNTCEDIEWCDGGGWLGVDEIEAGWPHTGTYIDNAGNEQVGRYRLKTKPEVLHAEMNALMKLAKSNESGDEATMFITHAPCIDCAKGMYQAGIKQVFYKTEYRDTAGLDFLNKCGLEIEQVKEDE